MDKGDRQNGGPEQTAGSRETQPAQRPAPGKVTRTSKLPAHAGAAIQRKESVSTGSAPPAQGRSASDPSRDHWLDAAHRGLSAASPASPAPVQASGSIDADPASVHEAAASGVAGSGGGLPYRDRIQESFGAAHDISGVRAHMGGAATQANERMGAQAYATGQDIAFRGQPDLHTAAHEAAHVVQQRAGVQLSGGVGQAGDAYERHADAVADRVVRGESAASLFDAGAGQSAGDTAVQRSEPEPGQSEDVVIRTGDLTTLGEGSDAATKFIHWPATAASGVTLGKGYDIGSRTREQVLAELTAAGMSEAQAAKIVPGAGLKGSAAGTFVTQNKSGVGEIAKSVQQNLLAAMLPGYTARARETATSTKADTGGRNAAGREKKEGVAAGTYVMSDVEWSSLHPAMVELLTDLIYQGGYYGYDRVAKVNAALKKHHGDHLAQLAAVRTLFADGYMDTYAGAIGEAKSKTGAKETFYGQEVDLGGEYRRNQIRLAYLDHVIAALEAGKTVRVEKPGQQTNAAGNPGGAPAGDKTDDAGPAPVLPQSTAGAPSSTPPLPRSKPTAQAAQTAQPRQYVVKRGEGLARLAAKFGVSVDALKQANAAKLQTWGRVQGFYAGETISIPSAAAGAPAPAETGTQPSAPAETAAVAAATQPGPQSAVEPAPRDSGTPEAAQDSAPASATAPATDVRTAEIQSSVGAGGVNKARDVRIVQQNLIHLGYLAEGAEVTRARQAADTDTISDVAETIEAIKQYQQFGLGQPKPDGLINAGKGTWQNMKARLDLIQEQTVEQIQTRPIDAVLASSQWVSQFPADAEKNGDGRGLKESEKAYAGKSNNVCCWDAAQVMTRQKGGQISHDTTSRIPTLLQQDGETKVLNKQAELGVKYIDQQLKSGKPVMIGVDDGRVEAYNADATTEHFIVIVGKVVKEGQVYYRYFDPGTRHGKLGYSENNLLHLGADFSLSGKSYSGSKDYRMAQVRQNQ